jgi:hypothetical protein
MPEKIKKKPRSANAGPPSSSGKTSSGSNSTRQAPVNGYGVLRSVLEEASAGIGCSLTDLTVLSAQVDPYRLDTPSGHRDAQWLARQLDRAVGRERRIHWRGLHYALVSTTNLTKSNGERYRNDDENWTWLVNVAGKAARWLGYIPFERITDNRNAPRCVWLRALTPAAPRGFDEQWRPPTVRCRGGNANREGIGDDVGTRDRTTKAWRWKAEGDSQSEGHRAGRPRKPREEFAPSVWEHGRAVVEVKQHHIDASLQRSSSHCAFAAALKEAIPHARFISIDLQSCGWTNPIKGVRYVVLTPHAVRDLILAFDQGEREKLHPFTVRLKPSFITRPGRSDGTRRPTINSWTLA